MSKLTDQCRVQSDLLSMRVPHQATHVIEWETLYYDNEPRNNLVKGKRAKKVMCICGETFTIENEEAL